MFPLPLGEGRVRGLLMAPLLLRGVALTRPAGTLSRGERAVTI